MSNDVSVEKAKSIMQENFIGPEELSKIEWLFHDDNIIVPSIPFSEDELETKKNDYILILGVDRLSDGRTLTIRNLQSVFGKDPDKSEPCFYNQDWYDKEDFIDTPMKNEWFLIRKEVYQDSRAVQPNELMKKYSFPSAVFRLPSVRPPLPSIFPSDPSPHPSGNRPLKSAPRYMPGKADPLCGADHSSCLQGQSSFPAPGFPAASAPPQPA